MSSSRWPNVQPAREQLHRALRLLDEKTDASLAEARHICAELSTTIPHATQPAQYCEEYRSRMSSTTCIDRSCGRCGPIRQQREH